MKLTTKAVVRSLKRMLVLQAALSSCAFAQDYLQGDAMREAYRLDGLGVVGREIAGEVSCARDSAENVRIPLLVSPDGPSVAEIEQRRIQYSCQVFLIQGDQSERLWRGWDLPEISFEAVALVYFEERDGFALVLKHTVPPGLWVRVSDVPDGRLHAWPELFVRQQHLYLGYDGHQLRNEPSDNAVVLVSLRDRQVHETNVHQLIPTGQISGDWGEFDVIEYDSEFYLLAQTREATPTGNRWKGWLRLVNDDGLPEFWFVTRD